MSNATVYCTAPTSVVRPLLGDPSRYEEITDENDTHAEYVSLVELWAPSEKEALAAANEVAETLSRHNIGVAVATDDGPRPYSPVRRSA